MTSGKALESSAQLGFCGWLAIARAFSLRIHGLERFFALLYCFRTQQGATALPQLASQLEQQPGEIKHEGQRDADGTT